MIKVPKKEWDKIPNDYKGKWPYGCQPNIPEGFAGKRNVLAGCIEKGGGAVLLTEGFHFEII